MPKRKRPDSFVEFRESDEQSDFSSDSDSDYEVETEVDDDISESDASIDDFDLDDRMNFAADPSVTYVSKDGKLTYENTPTTRPRLFPMNNVPGSLPIIHCASKASVQLVNSRSYHGCHQ